MRKITRVDGLLQICDVLPGVRDPSVLGTDLNVNPTVFTLSMSWDCMVS